ncbi:MAG: hypothetical protein ABI659_04420 [Nitrosospira sp.]
MKIASCIPRQNWLSPAQFPRLDLKAQRTITQDMQDVYKPAGLPDAFVQRIVQTVPQDMWYPTRAELISSNVISRASSGKAGLLPGISNMTGY